MALVGSGVRGLGFIKNFGVSGLKESSMPSRTSTWSPQMLCLNIFQPMVNLPMMARHVSNNGDSLRKEKC